MSIPKTSDQIWVVWKFRSLPPIGADWRQFGANLAPIGEFLAPIGANFWRFRHSPNWRQIGANLAPIRQFLAPIGANWRLIANTFRQELAPIGDWRVGESEKCDPTFNWRQFGANLANRRQFRKLFRLTLSPIGADWRQLAPNWRMSAKYASTNQSTLFRSCDQ